MEIPRFWRANRQRYNLEAEICDQGHYVFPQRDICPVCGEEAKTLVTLSGKGTVYSHTTIYEAPSDFDKNAPYPIALVKLDEGPMITAQLTDLGDEPVEIGMPVEMVTRKIKNDGDERGVIIYGYKFRPRMSDSS